MADTNTYTVSLALYRYLCQNIVGTENYVKTIRQLNAVRDDVMSTKSTAHIVSGSFGEGLEMRGSDLDVMTIEKLIEVYADENTRLNPNKLYFRMETDDVEPGFTRLLLEKVSIRFLKYYEELNGKYYFSSAIFKQRFLDTSGTAMMIHGPCLTDTRGYLDKCICLQCKTWISQASQWITRSNNAWPSYNVKQSIINQGVLIVPIGVKGSPNEDLEWRISFSVGEKMLISTFTHTQLSCYALLKILLKDVIATYTEFSDLLCSYFLKTIIFWISEELPQSIWKPDNLIPCFMRCFNRLIYCVKYSACLHYFIPENNMFENKIEGRAREVLLDKLQTLHRFGWRCVLFSNQLSCFHVQMWIDNVKPHTLHTIQVAKTLNSKLLFLSNCLKDDAFKIETYEYKRIIHQIVSCDQSSLKYLYTYYMSLSCAKYAQSIQLISPGSSNKHQYKKYSSCLCYLLQGLHHDSVSGWLMLASFFYKSKQYSIALLVIEYSISKCTSEKLTRFIDMTDIHYKLLQLKSFQEISLVRLWKIMLADFMRFKRNSLLIPSELQMEVENRICFISSIVYAHFLKVLCHYYLNNVRQCQDSIQTLQLVITEHYCIEKDTYFQNKAYNILGIALQLSGDYKAARQAFMQSLKIYPDHKFNTSFKRLSLMTS
ncbi:Hypothetical predicted protein [Mytilus galloprovincialis]|uniref:Mab-21-like HhH/H2TH-like domain-containing protein n=1 Tax=Mytilus galloprovincialis TaxID=29158 RepID=A0A8B6FE56_MYTGA|nr:Hypothetical predicted protein [Mytilus galloprovincialis]